MATATQVPVEVYLKSDYSPDAEYLDGVILERPVGENDHSAWQDAICAWFREHRDAWNLLVRPEFRVQVKIENFLVPDVSILDAAHPTERFATRPPIAVFEVLSPENKIRDILRKLDLYEQMGIPEIWVIDPPVPNSAPVWQRFERGRLNDRDRFEFPERGIHFEMKEIDKLVR